MTEPIIYLRRDGQVRRLVGPHRERVAKERIAEGWERFEPAQPFDATVSKPAGKAPKRTASRPGRARSRKAPKAKATPIPETEPQKLAEAPADAPEEPA